VDLFPAREAGQDEDGEEDVSHGARMYTPPPSKSRAADVH
jgi:hypothetical protein